MVDLQAVLKLCGLVGAIKLIASGFLFYFLTI
jgi:hypothetical protein